MKVFKRTNKTLVSTQMKLSQDCKQLQLKDLVIKNKLLKNFNSTILHLSI